MDLKVEISLSKEERERLRRLLPRQDRDRVDELAGLVAGAGARELLAQAMGTAVFSSMADLRLFRIYSLIQEGIGISEAERLVAVVFKVPPSTARRLVGNAIARYGADLVGSVGEAIAARLEAACWQENRWIVDLPTAFMRDGIFDFLRGLVPPQPDPERAQRGSRFRFPNETYQALRRDLGLPERKDRPACDG